MAAQKPNQSHDTRTTIVKTAKELFMELGYRAVSTRQIAAVCGITQPALYHHFSDKQSIYVEVMRYVCEGTRQALESIIGRETTAHERLFHATAYMIANHPEDLSRMFHDIRHELTPESQAAVYALWKNAYLVPIVSIFESGQLSGELRNSGQLGIDPVMSARLLMGLINQTLSSQAAGAPGSPAAAGAGTGRRGTKEYEQQARMLVNVLLYGLSAAEPPTV
ncbi:TetR/AcrR family transcriptional regulator [Paenibacillus rhizovicinus]|uniref:TetR/AcrR family transcriptional regulator n=1 Tax=Paenibacillus rhizovicinus TaxID=2704463 RepID=A0A6C0NYD4_9BACL|nr:TetR/AcrR family transcriptional regulator [Paenibacillus rhizovicinus]QHW30723.1 TetR/AcrR family transcriptional regulator [Paenibacillus rhizovicinus]